MDRKEGDKATIWVQKRKEFEYYQEEMVAQFSKEGIVALALQVTTRIDELVDITRKLMQVFREEFVPLALMSEISKDFIVKLMEDWHENGTLTYDMQNQVVAIRRDSEGLKFVNYLIHLMSPYVVTYFIAAKAANQRKRLNYKHVSQKLNEKF